MTILSDINIDKDYAFPLKKKKLTKIFLEDKAC